MDILDELVRGVAIVGTPLSSFAKILMSRTTPTFSTATAARNPVKFPVSAQLPALLVSEIEIQKRTIRAIGRRCFPLPRRKSERAGIPEVRAASAVLATRLALDFRLVHCYRAIKEPPPEPDPLLRAMQDELKRSLRLRISAWIFRISLNIALPKSPTFP